MSSGCAARVGLAGWVFGQGGCPGLGGGCGFLSVDEPVPQAFQVQFLQDGFGPFPGVPAGAAGFAGDDQLVLHGVFPAHQFRYRHLVAPGLQ